MNQSGVKDENDIESTAKIIDELNQRFRARGMGSIPMGNGQDWRRSARYQFWVEVCIATLRDPEWAYCIARTRPAGLDDVAKVADEMLNEWDKRWGRQGSEFEAGRE